MKKSLLAMAAMTAFAGAAQAQSSVTVYGILDVGFSGISTKGADTAYGTGLPVDATKNASQRQTNLIGSGYEATSRLGFKGTEDLGNGTSAFFTVELQLEPASASNTLTNRQAFVGVAKKGLGNVAFGTQYTPIFNSMTATNPGANNSVVGSMIYPLTGANATTSEALTVRKNNAVTFATDKFAGFSAQGIFSVANQDSNQTADAYSSTAAGGVADAYSYGLAVNYNWQKLLVTGAWQQNRTKNTAAVVPGTAAGYAGTLTGATANSGDNQYYAAATYDFGILKAYAGYINRQITSSVNSNVFVKRAGTQLGVRSYITPTIEAWGQVGMGRYTAAGVGEPTANFTTYQVGANYYLSKRTNLYAIYGANSTSTTSNIIGVNTSAAASQYAMGVRHTF